MAALLSPLPVPSPTRSLCHSEKMAEIAGAVVCNLDANEPTTRHPHHVISEEAGEEDDNIVHILASLESHRPLDRPACLDFTVSEETGQRQSEVEESGREGEAEEGESEDEEWVDTDSEMDEYDGDTKESKHQRWGLAPNPSFTASIRSFACEKHSKWKKKCPTNCPLRKEHARVPVARRKLWTKKESAMLVQWADDVVGEKEKETEIEWEDIAKTLNRSVNSTKKKFMRLTNQWSRKSAPSSPTMSSLRPRTSTSFSVSNSGEAGNNGKRRREEDETWREEEDESETEEMRSTQCGDVRNERRATIVCEKHRRWKKRCPADCKDKQEEAQAISQTVTGGKPKTRHRLAGVVGRPAVSCRRHQLEHQKCPEDCPRRRTVDQYRHDRAQKRKDPHRPSPSSSSFSSSSSSPSRAPLPSCPSFSPPPVSSTAFVTSDPGNSPSKYPHGSPLPAETAEFPAPTEKSDFSDTGSQNRNSAFENSDSVGQDFRWYRPRERTTVSTPGIVLDLHDCRPPRVSYSRSSGFGTPESRTSHLYPTHTLVAVPDPFLSSSPSPSSPSRFSSPPSSSSPSLFPMQHHTTGPLPSSSWIPSETPSTCNKYPSTVMHLSFSAFSFHPHSSSSPSHHSIHPLSYSTPPSHSHSSFTPSHSHFSHLPQSPYSHHFGSYS